VLAKDQNIRKMIVPVEKINKPKKPTIARKLVKSIRKALIGERYPLKEIENFVNAEKATPLGAMTRASVKAVLTPSQEETQEEPATFCDETLKYATIRRTYSVRYKYNRFN
jgi:hypothetical protein